MKIAFTGDLSLHNIEKYTNDPFEHIYKYLANIRCVINLESVVLPKRFRQPPIKEKQCLWQDTTGLKHLRRLNPLVVNLANNHINDYGNVGITNTLHALKTEGISSFGAGDVMENHNIFALTKERILFLSYCTRSTDLTYSILFNEKDFMGPKELSIELFKKQVDGYDNYVKIILLHWGHEHRHYPLPEQRILGKKLIELGADLILGTHSHVVQGYEKHMGKWIFYCLGHFLFPNYVFETSKRRHQYTAKKPNQVSLFPLFTIDRGVVRLEKINYLEASNSFKLSFRRSGFNYNIFLFSNDSLYKMFYMTYIACVTFTKKCKQIYFKILKFIGLNKFRLLRHKKYD